MPYEYFDVKNLTKTQIHARANPSAAGKSMLKNPLLTINTSEPFGLFDDPANKDFFLNQALEEIESLFITRSFSKVRNHRPATERPLISYVPKVCGESKWASPTPQEEAFLVQQKRLVQAQKIMLEQQIQLEEGRKKNLSLTYEQVLRGNTKTLYEFKLEKLNLVLLKLKKKGIIISSDKIEWLEFELKEQMNRINSKDDTAADFRRLCQESPETPYSYSTNPKPIKLSLLQPLTTPPSTGQAKITSQQAYTTTTLDDVNRRRQATFLTTLKQ